jgi:hypothetical protein
VNVHKQKTTTEKKRRQLHALVRLHGVPKPGLSALRVEEAAPVYVGGAQGE